MAPQVLFCDTVLAPVVRLAQEPQALLSRPQFRACLTGQAQAFHLGQQVSAGPAAAPLSGPAPGSVPAAVEPRAPPVHPSAPIVGPSAPLALTSTALPAPAANEGQAVPPPHLLAGTSGTVLLTGMTLPATGVKVAGNHRLCFLG